MTKYEIVLYWSDEDEAFIAADGATRQKALAKRRKWMEPLGNSDDLSLAQRPASVCVKLPSRRMYPVGRVVGLPNVRELSPPDENALLNIRT
jgi:hypothetical protein